MSRAAAEPRDLPSGSGDGADEPRAVQQLGRRARRLHLQSVGPAAILLVLVVIFSFASHQFLRLANLEAILESASIALVLSTAVTFIVLMGSIDLSLEGVMATASIALSLLVACTW